jgi:hypothetical protein
MAAGKRIVAIDGPTAAGAAALGLLAGLAALGWSAGLAPPAAAQVTCRTNALGAEICMGLPAPSNRGGDPFARPRRGLAGVQPPVRAGTGPALTPARRTDARGNTFLSEDDLPPGRPPLPGVAPTRDCRRDALGNLLCN